MKITKLIGIFVLLFIISLTSVFAAPPPQYSEPTIGLEIEAIQIQYIKSSTDFNVETHVFNSTNGLQVDNATTSCDFDLYDNVGLLVIEQQLAWDGEEFTTLIGGANFSRIGHYAYEIDCNSSSQGGFVSSSFDVTETGFGPETYAGLELPVMLVLICVILLLGTGAMVTTSFMRYGLTLLTILSISFTLNIAANFTLYALNIGPVQNLLWLAYGISNTTFWVVMLFTMYLYIMELKTPKSPVPSLHESPLQQTKRNREEKYNYKRGRE